MYIYSIYGYEYNIVLTSDCFYTDEDLENIRTEWYKICEEESKTNMRTHIEFHDYLIDVKGFKHIEYTASIFED